MPAGSGPYALSDEDRLGLIRQGLLRSGLATLSPRYSVGDGLLAGFGNLGEDARNLREQRYRDATMQRMDQAMQRNEQIEALYPQFSRDHGGYDYQGLIEAMAPIDPMRALELRRAIAPDRRQHAGQFMAGEDGTVAYLGIGDNGQPFAMPVPMGTPQAGPGLSPPPSVLMPLDNLFSRVRHAESAGDPNAVSPAGARGLMQLMPPTARMLEQQLGMPDGETDRSPQANQQAGEHYLLQQIEKYGDIPTALMAYNWGPGNVDRWIADGRRPEQVPAETRAYVQQITGQSIGGGQANVPQYFRARPTGGRQEAQQHRRMTPQEVVSAGYPAGSVVQINTATGEERVVSQPRVADARAADRAAARDRMDEAALLATQEQIENIDRFIRMGGPSAITGIWDSTIGRHIPTTDAANADAILETIRANSAFGSLTEMRANSPTGGALGQITVRELELLQSAETALSTAQDEDQFTESLNIYRRRLEDIVRKLRAQTAPAESGVESLSDEELLRSLGL